MNQQDELAFELAMAVLRDTREDYLRRLDDPDEAGNREHARGWWSAR